MSSTTPGPSPDAAFTPIASTILHLASDIFNSFRTLSAGTSDIEEPGLRLRIQARRFAEWAREWGVREEGGHEYAQTRAQIDRVARGAEDIREMLEQVVDCLGDVFYSGGMFGLLPASTADGATVNHAVRRLQGLPFSSVPTEKRKEVISSLRSVRWVCCERSSFDRFIKILRDFIDDLYYTLELERRQRLERSAMSTLILRAESAYDSQAKLLLGLADAAAKEAELTKDYEVYSLTAPKVCDWYVVLSQVCRIRVKVKKPARAAAYEASVAFRSINEYEIPDYLDLKATFCLAFEKRHHRLRLVEWKRYDVDGVPSETLKENIRNLLRLFAIDARPADFRMLPCKAYIKDERHMRYGLVYKLPELIGTVSTLFTGIPSPRELGIRFPQSLKDLLERTILDLGLRFQLARQLANSLQMLHAAGLTHRDIRPGNILFFAAESKNQKGKPSCYRLNIGMPYLVNYGLSRPNSEFDSSMYIHPRRFLNPESPYIPAYDIYALGLVLLEIGMWAPLNSLLSKGYYTSGRTTVLHKEILEEVLPDLAGNMGATYRDVVRECLKMGFDSGEGEKECAKTLCWKVAGKLDRLHA